MERKLEPLPSQPWTQDVRIWRNGDTGEPCGASIPRSVIWHSPDGFNFGYGGSGPADLALNILNAFVPPVERDDSDDYTGETLATDPVPCFKGKCSHFAAQHHQAFKAEFIAGLRDPGGTIAAATIQAWIASRSTCPPRGGNAGD